MKKAKKKKPRSTGIINYLGDKVITKVLTLKELPGWEGWNGVPGISDSYVFGAKGEIVGWLKIREKQQGRKLTQIFTFKQDGSIYPADGWDLKKAMRFAYLMTQKQNENFKG